MTCALLNKPFVCLCFDVFFPFFLLLLLLFLHSPFGWCVCTRALSMYWRCTHVSAIFVSTHNEMVNKSYAAYLFKGIQTVKRFHVIYSIVNSMEVDGNLSYIRRYVGYSPIFLGGQLQLLR